MIAQATAKPGADQVDFRVAGASHDAYPGETFDVILAFNLLHLLPDLETALKGIHEMLPTGGHFISKTPAIGEKWYFRPMIWAMQLVGKAPFVRMVKVAELDRLIEAAGFKIVETGLYPPTTPSRFIVAQKA